MDKIFFAVAVDASNTVFITSRNDDESWTYQEVCGLGGRVLFEGTESECEAACDAYLSDFRPSKGDECSACGRAWSAPPGQIPMTEYTQTQGGFFTAHNPGKTLPCPMSHGRAAESLQSLQ